jgi:hypothetical protein
MKFCDFIDTIEHLGVLSIFGINIKIAQHLRHTKLKLYGHFNK